MPIESFERHVLRIAHLVPRVFRAQAKCFACAQFGVKRQPHLRGTGARDSIARIKVAARVDCLKLQAVLAVFTLIEQARCLIGFTKTILAMRDFSLPDAAVQARLADVCSPQPVPCV